jgi:hypothetical protein
MIECLVCALFLLSLHLGIRALYRFKCRNRYNTAWAHMVILGA